MDCLLNLESKSPSAIAYAEALEQSAKISNESGPSVANRVVERTLVLQRSATAAAVCSVLFQRKVSRLSFNNQIVPRGLKHLVCIAG